MRLLAVSCEFFSMFVIVTALKFKEAPFSHNILISRSRTMLIGVFGCLMVSILDH